MNENNTNDFEIDKLNDIKVNHWNCNSIKNKQLEFKNYLHVNKPDVVSLNEIKCCNNWANE
jgi:exonuclease III